ncbi:MAG TPA: hypothetical protein VLG12_04060 [Candidatus Saccharimonadales bacterium]|nr:hypothetical protein [Candidatus Saccharimonadales bacterium]
METPLQDETIPQENLKQDNTLISKKRHIYTIVIIIFLLISIPIFLRTFFQSKGKHILTIPFKTATPIDYNNIVFSSDANSFFLTDLLSEKTTSVDMHLSAPFKIPYGQLTQYNNILSPNRKSALFLKDHNIWKIDFPTKKLTQLTTIGRAGEGTLWSIDAEFPTWSPNGKLIYYSVNADPPDNVDTYPGMQTPPDIQEGTWVMNADGKQQKYLPLVINPRGWMPDNKTIIFADQPYETSDTKSYNIATGKVNTFVKGLRIANIMWDKHGEKGLYTASNLSASFLIDKNGNILATLPHDETSSQKTLHTFLLSPDGKYILITKDAANDTLDVFLWNTQTKEKMQLPITFSSNTKPFWDQDSSKLIYAKLIENESRLFVYDLFSQQETQIITFSNNNPSYIDY